MFEFQSGLSKWHRFLDLMGQLLSNVDQLGGDQYQQSKLVGEDCYIFDGSRNSPILLFDEKKKV